MSKIFYRIYKDNQWIYDCKVLEIVYPLQEQSINIIKNIKYPNDREEYYCSYLLPKEDKISLQDLRMIFKSKLNNDCIDLVYEAMYPFDKQLQVIKENIIKLQQEKMKIQNEIDQLVQVEKDLSNRIDSMHVVKGVYSIDKIITKFS